MIFLHTHTRTDIDTNALSSKLRKSITDTIKSLQFDSLEHCEYFLLHYILDILHRQRLVSIDYCFIRQVLKILFGPSKSYYTHRFSPFKNVSAILKRFIKKSDTKFFPIGSERSEFSLHVFSSNNLEIQIWNEVCFHEVLFKFVILPGKKRLSVITIILYK